MDNKIRQPITAQGYKKISLGLVTTLDVRQICQENNIDYTTLTADNFLISSFANAESYPTGPGSITESAKYGGILTLTKTYNSTTGVFTVKVYVQHRITYNGSIIVSGVIVDEGATCFLVA